MLTRYGMNVRYYWDDYEDGKTYYVEDYESIYGSGLNPKTLKLLRKKTKSLKRQW